MPELLYSVRMRAARGGRHEDGGCHVSGAERLVTAPEVEEASLELLRRARRPSAGVDFIQISIEPVSEVVYAPCLPLICRDSPDPTAARREAEGLLTAAGAPLDAISEAFRLLTAGAGREGRTLRGALLLDGKVRREPNPERGVRATRMDFAPGVRARLRQKLEAGGLGHFRTLEALAVATKVLWSGVLAELCWSDDAEYEAGYVATPAAGYVRFPRFKPPGAAGGRAFFLASGTDVAELVQRLESQAILIAEPHHSQG